MFDLRGLHSHIGSQIFDTGGFEMAARRLVGLHAQIVDEHGHHCPEIDLGGGYGIAYTSQHTPLSVATLAQEMADIVGRELKAVGDGDNTRVPRVRSSPAAPSSARAPSPSTRSAPSRTSRSGAATPAPTSRSTAG